MSVAEFGFGAIPSPPDARDILFSAIIREFPAELNLAIPEKYESPPVTPVKSQGRERTCVGFASAVGMNEAQESKEENKYFELSPRYLYQKCVPVYKNWEEASTNGIIPLSGDLPYCSHHAICIVGCDDTNQKMEFKNSWGDLWGDKGFVYLIYEYINRYLNQENGIEAWCALDFVIRLSFVSDSELSGWIGKFSGTEDQLLFFDSNNDGWLCSKTGDGNAKCNPIGNTNGFGGAPRGCPTWIGKFSNFSNIESDEILFYFPGDDNWWLGTFNDKKLVWKIYTSNLMMSRQ
jgi:hypothetical protein